jgi:quercetin dioxygenase-like cupin family protein
MRFGVWDLKYRLVLISIADGYASAANAMRFLHGPYADIRMVCFRNGIYSFPCLKLPERRGAPLLRSRIRGGGYKMNAFYKLTLATVAVIGAAALSSPLPAFAGECPAGQQGSNELVERPASPKGVSDKVIGAIDLGSALGVNGRDLRLRRLIIQPGGVVPFHSHNGRPAIIITLKGQILEYASNCRAPIVHRAGETVNETAEVSHYWVNRGKTVVELLSADVKGRE